MDMAKKIHACKRLSCGRQLCRPTLPSLLSRDQICRTVASSFVHFVDVVGARSFRSVLLALELLQTILSDYTSAR